ncbi:GARP complex subunit [Xylona heveae TC161]|uniref:GARP complex subunit n=1 Tax=Xylona heveae (strain CBS 132557 / TC161) TaxID=1328760 RepID=A0A165HFK6_XYLHT|nr:GARP complex subunit [Xylona heveae TC161]KZF23438.1 GARP complex subunit [Xylona heveae TC161]
MWLDRLAGHTASGSPGAQNNRSYSPAAPRRTSHLAPRSSSARPGLSPRASTLSLISNTSTSSLPSAARLPNGSSLRNQVSQTAPLDVPDPIHILQGIIGVEIPKKQDPADSTWKKRKVEKPVDIVENPDFGNLSLEAFAEGAIVRQDVSKHAVHKMNAQSIAEYEKDKDKFEELHRSITACDNVLKTVEAYFTTFETDLGAVSTEIETLQAQSTALNNKLENRRLVERALGPAVEEISIAPTSVRKIAEGPVDEAWIKALNELESLARNLDKKFPGQEQVKAVEDIRSPLENLRHRAIERIRDFLVTQIKSLRTPNVNAQILQRQNFLKHKDAYKFLAQHHAQLAGEIGQAYINTMRWYYVSHFSRYQKALEKLKVHVFDKHDVLGLDEHGRRSHLGGSKAAAAPHDAFNLGRRIDLLRTTNDAAISSYLAEEDKSTHYLEVPFRNFNQALIDNASAEFLFLTEFFAPNSFHDISRKFMEIFEPTFALGQALTKQLIDTTVDCLGVLLCVRLNQKMAFKLQRRKVPTVETYINGTNMLLWPRFQIIMDMHCDSIRRIASATSRSATSALSLSAPDASKQSAAPHYLTQRFSQLLQGILALSSEAGDDEPVSSSLGRLRTEYEAFLMKISKGVTDPRKKERFLYNNYSLVLTIITDTEGKLSDEQREHFEVLKRAFSESSG